jgi:hypothetical protein
MVLGLVWQAKARLVRVWAMQWFRKVRESVGMELKPASLLHLLDHADEEVAQFGAELLQSAAGLEKMPVSFWLQLLRTRNLTALLTICDIVTKHVSAERLDLTQCLELACAEATPVARLGLQFLKGRVISTAQDRAALSGIANARCSAVGKELAGWALGILGKPEVYALDQVQGFFDSLLAEVRQSAWEWLLAPGCPAYNDPVLWSRLTETPFDDLRLRLVDHLEKRSALPVAKSNEMTSLWCSVLLGVHRGGRQKAKAVRQVGAAIQEDPTRAETLLPVLAVALRSVRLPEARAGLAAVVSAVEARPEIADLVKKNLPELQLLD